jgi:hypothetical protein
MRGNEDNIKDASFGKVSNRNQIVSFLLDKIVVLCGFYGRIDLDTVGS